MFNKGHWSIILAINLLADNLVPTALGSADSELESIDPYADFVAILVKLPCGYGPHIYK